jgi:sulfur-oxidizing protein SoxX
MNKVMMTLILQLLAVAAMADSPNTRINQGKAIAFDRGAGNCLSCHMILGGELPGEIGPPLIQMKLRFPDRAVLKSQIYDAALRNSDTVMPPYGRHNILTNQELDLVVDFIHSL